MPYSEFKNIRIASLATCIPKNNVVISTIGHFSKSAIETFASGTGTKSVRRSLENQTASDLGYTAANAAIVSDNVDVEQIGGIIFVSTTPDYRSPATACVLQHRLRIPKDCIAYDVNLGGAGFVQGLQIACSLLQSVNRKYFLLVNADTTSKQTDEHDLTSFVYSDGASAVVLEKMDGAFPINVFTKSISQEIKFMSLAEGAFRYGLHTKGSIKRSEDIFERLVNSEIHTSMKEFWNVSGRKRNSFNLVVLPQLSYSQVNIVTGQLEIENGLAKTVFPDYGELRGASIPLSIAKFASAGEAIDVLGCVIGEGASIGVAAIRIERSAILPIIESDDYFVDGMVSHEL